ncbi:transmembrane protein, putative (macronuclear) [Tetrahymena thermophila SB210]|uniref:Transmembrane protein, putative n=1 Tax=Tetrahymena thermophila (strain SB210) TaxID=312017 RepID=W7X7Y3_TETTS|nr:transmembrane protein, putative [Tetrahymena thermophila SB210]EWS75495.1 transmembrane protein, putative [Tetrahymena thermophila SB210]|eukprot:XP_012651964.1 transmembrane protein, putative [Tetrahymena thermophila SB210]
MFNIIYIQAVHAFSIGLFHFFILYSFNRRIIEMFYLSTSPFISVAFLQSYLSSYSFLELNSLNHLSILVIFHYFNHLIYQKMINLQYLNAQSYSSDLLSSSLSQIPFLPILISSQIKYLANFHPQEFVLSSQLQKINYYYQI